MNAPVRVPAPVDLLALDLLFVWLELLVSSLERMVEAEDVVAHAQDLQDAITSYRRAVDGFEEDDIPF